MIEAIFGTVPTVLGDADEHEALTFRQRYGPRPLGGQPSTTTFRQNSSGCFKPKGDAENRKGDGRDKHDRIQWTGAADKRHAESWGPQGANNPSLQRSDSVILVRLLPNGGFDLAEGLLGFIVSQGRFDSAAGKAAQKIDWSANGIRQLQKSAVLRSPAEWLEPR